MAYYDNLVSLLALHNPSQIKVNCVVLSNCCDSYLFLSSVYIYWCEI